MQTYSPIGIEICDATKLNVINRNITTDCDEIIFIRVTFSKNRIKVRVVRHYSDADNSPLTAELTRVVKTIQITNYLTHAQTIELDTYARL